jgi:alpha-galactosidase
MNEINKNSLQIIKDSISWQAPEITGEIMHGDMPGDKVSIGEDHIKKAGVIFPELLRILPDILENNPAKRAVITVCGGSGVGKSEIASLISHYFNSIEVGSYTLSGDNYPHRIPQYNDAERLRIFRENGIQGMLEDGVYNEERFQTLQELQKAGDDANTVHIASLPWISSYINGGKKGLQSYLGTSNEIGFNQLSSIVSEFKNGANEIWLKRMGREETELWYDKVDFSKTSILVIEWTHGNSDNYQGVDVPILLNSTPQETLAHRRARNRDGKTDSAFTMRVLEMEQALLESQAHKAKIIVSKQGELLNYDQYEALMKQAKEQENE